MAYVLIVCIVASIIIELIAGKFTTTIELLSISQRGRRGVMQAWGVRRATRLIRIVQPQSFPLTDKAQTNCNEHEIRCTVVIL
ncbi:hypothetical protein DFH29DRAFT_936906 [Suillus ampliporus]|nr:hypothetical protein DFH29DRAFT_936906 [Suillus ampliporus]